MVTEISHFLHIHVLVQPMHVESINWYTTLLYMVLELAGLYQCADYGAPINQSMSDEVKVLIFY